MKRALLLSALAVLAAACQQESHGRPPPPPPPPGVTAQLTVKDGAGTSGPFRLAALDRLVVEATYDGGEAGSHPARIDVITPRGTLYAQFPGTLEVTSGRAVFSRTLEVAGTPIDAYQQVGAWRFVLTVDEGAPLATAEVSLVE